MKVEDTYFDQSKAAVLLAFFFSVFLAKIFQKPRTTVPHDAKEPPFIPSHVPFIGHGIPFLKDFSKLMQQLRSKHGPIFTINIFGQRQHFITSYTDIQKIWKHPEFDFKEFAYKAESHFSGMESPQELKRTKIGAHTLAQYAHTMRGSQELEQLAIRFQNALTDAADSYHVKSDEFVEVDLRQFCTTLIFHAAGKSLFGNVWLENVNVEKAIEQYTLFEDDAPGIAGGLPQFLIRKGCRARDYLAKHVLLPIVKDGCEHGGHTYIIEYMKQLKSAYENDPKGDLKIASRLAGLLFAIMTNTMNTLFWAVAEVIESDESLKSDLQQELQNVDEANFSSYLECKKHMPLLNSIIIETFRLHADPNSFRIAEQDCIVKNMTGGDYFFRKGDMIFLLSTYDQLKDVKEDRDVFDGRRWLESTRDDNLNSKLLPIPSNQVLAPFGGGKHLCPGRFFALLEMHLVISYCLKKFEFQKIDGQNIPSKVVELSAPINVPKSNMKVLFRCKK